MNTPSNATPIQDAHALVQEAQENVEENQMQLTELEYDIELLTEDIAAITNDIEHATGDQKQCYAIELAILQIDRDAYQAVKALREQKGAFLRTMLEKAQANLRAVAN